MTRTAGTGFLAPFTGFKPRSDGLVIFATLPPSCRDAVEVELAQKGDWHIADGDPPVILVPAPRWPTPPERDEPVIVEALLEALIALVRRDDFALTDPLAFRFDELRAALQGDLIRIMPEANDDVREEA